MAIDEIVVVAGRVFAEHDHADAGLFGGGDDLVDRAAAIVRKRRVDVQQRAHVVVAAGEAHLARCDLRDSIASCTACSFSGRMRSIISAWAVVKLAAQTNSRSTLVKAHIELLSQLMCATAYSAPGLR